MARPASDTSRGQRVVPFSIHQAGEYLLGALIIATALHISGASQVFLLAGGVLLVALAAFSDGPLGAWKVLGRRGHRVADWVAVATLALLPILPGRTIGSTVVLEACAFCLWRFSVATRYHGRPTGPARRSLLGYAARELGRRSAAAPPSRHDLTVRRSARKAGLAAGIINRRRQSPPPR